MNYLVHLYLSDGSPGGLLGNLMGDFVKGSPDAGLAPDIRAGILQHRRIDAFAQTNPHFRRSKRRLDDRFGHCKGILVDVFYDHFLARTWRRHHPLSLEEFATQVYQLLQAHFAILPPGLQEVAPRMIEHNWLVSYRETATIERVLHRLAARLSRPTPLAEGFTELLTHYEDLGADCSAFLADARQLSNLT
ncbi:ACP phosphodiesterase [Geoalkalibacter halelectricus]|uniref:ACP phosphodiesterase n=1 Tax=Geoalkalibacter halelectricus TaxID=2847045 RepID=A0ABY5ZR81_9BACT|nr:ACP phosphodiesterase [Geoalkalibacter halelectricus]MDO3376904.1 ACP phosphodiesterase [Geoalkalibacter halelectricus]UWZ81128.1 ACP phosphodiesterase [Geoalkalibacter halelectricus]